MLIKIYRRIIFIHDKYIFASIYNSSIINDLLTYVTSPKRQKIDYKSSLYTLLEISDDEELIKLLREEFFDKVKEFRTGDTLRSIEPILEKIRVPPSVEYMIRTLPRSKLRKLVMRGFVWFIPFTHIFKVTRKTIEDKDVLEIRYLCPITGKTNIFRTLYNDELYELIRQLCIHNGNNRCS
ncbi:MAG: hypothetical protein B6U89_06445 [Desulfurococcales archaeon ex4484_58]|nr:MAG: hypothetical protein B6U89_06445 [Desulfurococcales archaeon ex4484_58]